MKKEPKLFTGILTCECGWKMRYIKDGKNSKYICGQYSTYKDKCSRNPVKESDLIFWIKNAYDLHNRQLELNNDFLKKEIKRVIVFKDGSLKIEFNVNLPNIELSKDKLSFI